jgi:two-component system, NarL family, sensor histidine kinase YdfH
MADLDQHTESRGDRRRLAALLGALVAITAAGIVGMVAGGHYNGAWAIRLNAEFLVPFGVLLVVHVALYAVAPRPRTSSWRVIAWFALQLFVAVALSLVAGRSAIALFFFVAWCAQGVALFPARWPLVLLVGITAAFLALSVPPLPLERVVGNGAVVATVVLSIYLIQFVRGTQTRHELRSLVAELGESRTRLREYAADIEEAALVDERKRLARELHDTLAQGLAGVALQLEAADAQLDQGGLVRAREIVRNAMEHARETLREARRAIDGLRAEPEVGRSAFDTTLRTQLRRFTAATGIPVELSADDVSLPPIAADHVRRIVAEGLGNVARHARATRVELSVKSVNGQTDISLSDNGTGFDPKAGDAPAGHYGLLGIGERVRALSGTFTVDSTPGGGTTLRVRFPRNDPPQGDRHGH